VETFYLVDKFANVKPGDPIRLFPFTTISKGGRRHKLTAELARRFKLPHFKPAIKLGSHDDGTPAGGFIVGLFVGEDGLYAETEWTEKGLRALEEGDYRYHSPEVLWEGWIEDAATGEKIPGPLILGTALLHTPALGEAAALYSIDVEDNMSDTVEIPRTFWEELKAKIFPERPESVPEAPKPEIPEEYRAAMTERDQYKAELERLKAEQAKAEQLAALVAQLQDQEKFGAMYSTLEAANEAAEMLVGMTAEQREWCMRNFSALAAQVRESALLAEHGSSGEGAPEDPAQMIQAAIQARMEEKHETYVQAFDALRNERPELFRAK
jgi:hypothetical protein